MFNIHLNLDVSIFGWDQSGRLNLALQVWTESEVVNQAVTIISTRSAILYTSGIIDINSVRYVT